MRIHSAVALALLATCVGIPASATTLPTLSDGNGIHVVELTSITDRQLNIAMVPVALERPVNVRVLLPSDYASTTERYPVLYLYHGTSGRASDWIVAGDAEATTVGLPVIVVMPDAGFDGDGGGWFSNWVDKTTAKGPANWETFHVDELIPWVDANFRTIAAREGRAVAGLSQGGFGSTTYPARHPDLFVSAASFSGAPDIDYNPTTAVGASAVIDAIEVGLNGTGPDAIFGSRVTNEINWQGHDPAELAENLRTVDLWLYTATGAPGPLDPVPANAGAMGIEALTHGSTLSFYTRALQIGLPVHFFDYMLGTHSWGYWARDLREYVGPMMYAFSHPTAVGKVNYKSVEKQWSQWGWTVSVDRPAEQEFTWLTDADATGFTLAGTGIATVTTPAFYAPGSVHMVNSSPVTATPDGQLTFSVTLGSISPPVLIGVPVSPAPNSTVTVTIS